MKYYLVDEIYPSDMDKIVDFLKNNASLSEIERLFWVELPDDHLNEEQSLHPDCRPHRFAVELGNDWIRAELFIRTPNSLVCTCVSYCDMRQRDFIFQYMENMLGRLDIIT